MLRIRKRLKECIKDMKGDFVIKDSHYEEELCGITKWDCFDSRYYDAYDGKSYIEIKKGQTQMWFNMIRYAEIFIKIGTQNTITLFVKYSKKKKRVDEIFIMDTKEIQNHLNMTPTKAACCILLNKNSKRSLHMQAAATAKDMRDMATFVVVNPDYMVERCFYALKKNKKKSRKRKRSKTAGITWNKNSKAYVVRATIDDKYKTIGTYKDYGEAMKLVNHALKEVSFSMNKQTCKGIVVGKGDNGWKIKWLEYIVDIPLEAIQTKN